MQRHFSTAITCVCLCSILSCVSKNAPTENPSGDIVVKTVFINGDSLQYIGVGSGETVVFVHGTLGDYHGFQGQVDTFSQQHRVIVYSRRYASPDAVVWPDSGAAYLVDPHVEDLHAFIRYLNAGPVHLVGHSYGALVALHTANQYPEFVRSLILGEPPDVSLIQNTPRGDSLYRDFETTYLSKAAAHFKSGNNEEAVDIFMQGVTGDSLAYEKIPAHIRPLFLENLAELKGVALNSEQNPSLTCGQLKALKIPVLLVGGEDSPVLFDSILDELERCMETETRVTLPQTSHELQDQSPAAFNRIALPFIEKH